MKLSEIDDGGIVYVPSLGAPNNNIQLLSWSEGDTRNCNTRGSVVARGRSPRATTLPRVLQSWCHPNGGTIIVLLYQTVIK